MKLFGLIGYPLKHSFSEKYFNDKFRKERITDCSYKLFPLAEINQLPDIIKENPSICGLNVTIPYKESVIPYLDESDEQAKTVGAVNCIKIIKQNEKNKLIGFNTDIIGFEDSLKPVLKTWHRQAIILGTGGGAKAVAYVLRKLGISFKYVSRNPGNSDTIGYPEINKQIIQDHLLIINTTPLGMFPNTGAFPQIPYGQLGRRHLLFDLIYNPELTLFLQKGKKQGATIKNGLEMLHIQAEKSWEIWKE